jgi:hypothetical protein
MLHFTSSFTGWQTAAILSEERAGFEVLTAFGCWFLARLALQL